MLGEPARRVVVRVEADLTLSLRPLLGAALCQAVLQTFASSCSFCASAITFWAT